MRSLPATYGARSDQLPMWLWLCYMQGMACNRKLEKIITLELYVLICVLRVDF